MSDENWQTDTRADYKTTQNFQRQRYTLSLGLEGVITRNTVLACFGNFAYRADYINNPQSLQWPAYSPLESWWKTECFFTDRRNCGLKGWKDKSYAEKHNVTCMQIKLKYCSAFIFTMCCFQFCFSNSNSSFYSLDWWHPKHSTTTLFYTALEWITLIKMSFFLVNLMKHN